MSQAKDCHTEARSDAEYEVVRLLTHTCVRREPVKQLN